MSFLNPTQNIQIHKIFFAKSSGFQSQFRRPYETVGTGTVVGEIVERIQQVGFNNPNAITPSLISNLGAEFIRPQAAPEFSNNTSNGDIYIPNGWNTPRYSFNMIATITNPLGGYVKKFIQGYTEHYDIVSGENTSNPHIDPRTRLIVNSITDMSDHQMYNSYSGVPYTAGRLENSVHLLYNSAWGGISELSSNPTSTDVSLTNMRPADAFACIQRNTFAETAFDLRTTQISKPTASRRTNSIQSNYLSDLIRGFTTASGNDICDSDPATSSVDIYGKAMGVITEKPISLDAFMRAIEQLTGMPVSNSFTMNELYKIDPTVGDRVELIRGGAVNRITPYDGVSDSAYWNSADYETPAVTMIFNSLPGIMLKYGLAALSIHATNHSMNGPVIAITNFDVMSGRDISEFEMSLKHSIQSELIDVVSMNNQIAYNILIDCNLFLSSHVTIKLDNRAEISFVSPTFADALTSPVVTSDNTRLGLISNDIDSLVSAVNSVPNSTISNIVVPMNI